MDQSKAILISDIQTGHNGILMNGSKVELDDVTKHPHASTERPGSYIILGDFNGKMLQELYTCI